MKNSNTTLPGDAWMRSAALLLSYTQRQLHMEGARSFLDRLHISEETAFSCGLGWNENEIELNPAEWGFAEETTPFVVPAGLILAVRRRQGIISLVRAAENASLRELRGSATGACFVVGHSESPVCVTCSPYDACLAWQESRGLMAACALCREPDPDTLEFLKSALQVFVTPGVPEEWVRELPESTRAGYPAANLVQLETGALRGMGKSVRSWVNGLLYGHGAD